MNTTLPGLPHTLFERTDQHTLLERAYHTACYFFADLTSPTSSITSNKERSFLALRSASPSGTLPNDEQL